MVGAEEFVLDEAEEEGGVGGEGVAVEEVGGHLTQEVLQDGEDLVVELVVGGGRHIH